MDKSLPPSPETLGVLTQNQNFEVDENGYLFRHFSDTSRQLLFEKEIKISYYTHALRKMMRENDLQHMTLVEIEEMLGKAKDPEKIRVAKEVLAGARHLDGLLGEYHSGLYRLSGILKKFETPSNKKLRAFNDVYARAFPKLGRATAKPEDLVDLVPPAGIRSGSRNEAAATLLTVVLFIVSLVMLFFVKEDRHRLAAVCTLIAVFPLCLRSGMPNIKTHEMLGITAAYAAVLVVFLSGVSSMDCASIVAAAPQPAGASPAMVTTVTVTSAGTIATTPADEDKVDAVSSSGSGNGTLNSISSFTTIIQSAASSSSSFTAEITSESTATNPSNVEEKSNESRSNDEKAKKIGLIVGSAIAGVFALAVVASCYRYIRQRQRKRDL